MYKIYMMLVPNNMDGGDRFQYTHLPQKDLYGYTIPSWKLYLKKIEVQGIMALFDKYFQTYWLPDISMFPSKLSPICTPLLLLWWRLIVYVYD